jgi:hypothetical protein
MQKLLLAVLYILFTGILKNTFAKQTLTSIHNLCK